MKEVPKLEDEQYGPQWLSVLNLPAVLCASSLLPHLKREGIHKVHPHHRNTRTGHLAIKYV